MWTFTSTSCAAPMPAATRRTPSCAAVRARSETLRMVPSRFAVAGITLVVVPPESRVIVITTGSNASIRRVTRLCSASTISHATGIGSIV